LLRLLKRVRHFDEKGKRFAAIRVRQGGKMRSGEGGAISKQIDPRRTKDKTQEGILVEGETISRITMKKKFTETVAREDKRKQRNGRIASLG